MDFSTDSKSVNTDPSTKSSDQLDSFIFCNDATGDI